MVEQNWSLGLFWGALAVACWYGAVRLLLFYRRHSDLVALLFGVSSLWLGGAFGIAALIRCIVPVYSSNLVSWQRVAFAVCVLFLLGGVDAIYRARNGQMPRVRQLFARWEDAR